MDSRRSYGKAFLGEKTDMEMGIIWLCIIKGLKGLKKEKTLGK